jgi:threonine dehydratase
MELVDVLRARRRIAPYLRRTPLIESAWLSDVASARVSLKLESLQRSSSFKARGAFNAVLARTEAGRRPRQLVTASAGNHGRALADAAALVGLPLVVFTPADAPAAKLDAIRRHGAVLRAEAADYDEAERRAKAHAADVGADFISPYSDPDVIAGAATVALEIFEDRPGATALAVPIGGGGLVSGMGLVAKRLAPACEVVGVEAAASCPFQTSLRAGRLVEIVPGPTIADGLGGNPDPDTITFAFIERFVDRIVTVTEADLAGAVRGLIEREHLVSEGAGAAAPAALAARRLDVSGRDVVAVVSGANIDLAKVAALLQSDPHPTS